MNPRVREIPPSLIRAINARKRPGDLDLGLGEPTLPPDPAPFEAALAWTREHGSPYSPNAGFPELREQIAAYLGGGWSERNVCVTVGSEEALYLALKAVVDPLHDEVLIVEPCYLAYPKICVLEGIRHRMVPLRGEEGFRPRADRVLEALGPGTRLVVLNSPANPTGRVWAAEDFRALAEGLAEHPNAPIHVLWDEVYRELYYTPEAPPSITRWHPHSLVAGSLSKSNALTGLRLGWLGGPAEAVEAAVKVHQFVNTAAPTFSQRVAMETFREPVALAAHRAWYSAAREALLAAARRAGVALVSPEGAFYALVRLPPSAAGDSLGAAERLLEAARVVTVPGVAFGESAEGWLRVSWAGERAVVEEGIARIGEFLRGPHPAA